jgi:hypothetical protein
MDNPFQLITHAFQDDFRVNFSVERLDGSITLTLSDDRGLVAKRMIGASMLKDSVQLQRLIQSVKFGIAIERDGTAAQMLSTMIDGGLFDATATASPNRLGQNAHVTL